MRYLYVALFVPGLRVAEAFYQHVFGMELLFREGRLGDEWGTLPLEKGWEDADAAEVELEMLALRRDDIVLALFEGEPTSGTVLEICFGLAREEIDRIRDRLPREVAVLKHEEGFLQFDDPFGFRWTLQPPDAGFKSNGEFAGRWLDV